MTELIDLFTWTTPNGRKISVLLEELGVEYKSHPIDTSKNEQFAPDFLEIAPNNRIPAIVDHDANIRMTESGAIMLYLAEKYGKFMPTAGMDRWEAVEWLMWQMGGLGPMLGQVHHFVFYNKGKSEYSEKRYTKEAHRLYSVLEQRLEGREFIAGDYSITDMACWPWISRFDRQEIDLNDYPNVRDWYVRIAERPAVQRGYHVPLYVNDVPMP